MEAIDPIGSIGCVGLIGRIGPLPVESLSLNGLLAFEGTPDT